MKEPNDSPISSDGNNVDVQFVDSPLVGTPLTGTPLIGTPLIDSHCHFDFPEFDIDRDEVWRRCRTLNIQHIVIPGVSVSQWRRARTLANEYSGVTWSSGLHPYFLDRLDDVDREQAFAEMASCLQDSRCAAVGECGLDKSITYSLEKQVDIFIRHLDIAKNGRKPLIIHSRKTHSEIISLLKKYAPHSGGVIHAFSGSLEEAQRYIDLGFYLGVGGVISYDRAKKTRTAIQQIPLENLVLETDSPDMPISGFQGERNSPERIPLIAQCLAELKQCSVEDVAKITTRNAKQLFSL